MRRLGFILCIIPSILFSCVREVSYEIDSIIPQPLKLKGSNGYFVLDTNVKMYISDDIPKLSPSYTVFNRWLSRSIGRTLPVSRNNKGNGMISVSLNPAFPKEAYALDITPKSIAIIGGSEHGVAHAFQTLRQLIPAQIEKDEDGKNFKIPCGVIFDQPYLSYRGAMLDVSRHFFTVSEIKDFIDVLALHKFNYFQWHLSNDQGWRVEIEKYPRLVEVGSRRSGTVYDKESQVYDLTTVKGFYTQDDIKEIVKYASDRYVTVIPEISVPGYCQAILASYPELGCKNSGYRVKTDLGLSTDIFCAGKEQVYEFIGDLFDEIAPLFPSEYINIGGQMPPLVSWDSCRNCQAKLKELDYSTTDSLYQYFMKRVQQELNSHNKIIVGNDDLALINPSKDGYIISMNELGRSENLLRSGYRIVLSPESYVRFDKYQILDNKQEPLADQGYIDLSRVYDLTPSTFIGGAKREQLLGVQASLWTEYITDYPHLEYMMLPRLAALCEVGWSHPLTRDFMNFTRRLIHLTDRYDSLGYKYADHIKRLNIKKRSNLEGEIVEVLLWPNDGNFRVFYTLDGTKPTRASICYNKPIKIEKKTTLRAQLFKGKEPYGDELEEKIAISLASFKPLVLKEENRYHNDGKCEILTNGITGDSFNSTQEWICSEGEELELVIDLENVEHVSRVDLGMLQSQQDCIILPKRVRISSSMDGQEFKNIAAVGNIMIADSLPVRHALKMPFKMHKAKYIKLVIESNNAKVAIDEVGVY